MPKTAIITGASRGIGREIAVALADQGHQVIAIARSEEKLNKLHQAYPRNIQVARVDLTQETELNQFTKSISEKPIDILINNAGSLINKAFSELSPEDWQHMLDANLMSAINTTKAILPLLNAQSHIVNISSMGGFQGSSKFPGLTAYSVAKGALSILSECLAAEFADRQVAVNALCLGSVQTEMFNRAFPGFDAATQPEEMGTYIADFALNGLNFYNGKVLPVALNDPS